MCSVCGCGEGEVRVAGRPHDARDGHGAGGEPARPGEAAAQRPPLLHDGHHHHHHHDGDHHHHEGHRHPPSPDGHHHPPHGGRLRLDRIELDLLAKNDRFAAANRARFDALALLAVNLVSSPGAGKTTLLTATAAALGDAASMAVIEGDQETENDARRIRESGVPAVQINTGRVCHLDAHMVGHALDALSPAAGSLLFIENVGNLVCPAAFDLGEHRRVVLLSVTEGDDKPLKYPDLFVAADLVVLNKIDLLPHVDFDMARCREYARRTNPEVGILELSARRGEGLDAWLAWLGRPRKAPATGSPRRHA